MKKELPEGWEWKKIGDLIELKYGKGLKKGDRNHKGTIPVYGSNGIVDYHNVPLTQKSGLVNGRKGSVGAIHKSDVPFWAIDTTYYIESDDSLDISYLYYLFKTLKLGSLDKSTSIPGINRNDVYLKNIPVPPLETQRKIVAILEKAEATQRLRAEADALTDELVQSVFLEMFGDPVTNPMEWDKKKICDVCTTSTGGTPKRDHQEYYNGNIPWLKSGELKNSFISNSEEFISEEGLRNSSAKIVSKDTLLFALYGATVGKVGILKFDSAINQAICAISPRKDVTSNFLYYLLKISRKDLLRFRTGGAQPNLSQTILREYKIVLPPLPLQKKFEEITTMIQNSAEQQKISQIELGSLDENILSKAFTGELIT